MAARLALAGQAWDQRSTEKAQARYGSSGSGQVNFRIVPEEGWEIYSVSVSGTYGKLKDPEDTGTENVYRITKAGGELSVTVTLMKKSGNISVVTLASLEDAYQVEGNVLSCSMLLKAGYLSEGEFICLAPLEDGSFHIPEGADPVFLALAGDANCDGKVSNADSTKIKAVLRQGGLFEGYALFAADANCDGKLSNADSTKIKASLSGR